MGVVGERGGKGLPGAQVIFTGEITELSAGGINLHGPQGWACWTGSQFAVQIRASFAQYLIPSWIDEWLMHPHLALSKFPVTYEVLHSFSVFLVLPNFLAPSFASFLILQLRVISPT